MVARVRVRLRFSYDEPVGLRWTRESGDLRELKGSWRFQERGDGLTVATYALEIDVSRRISVLVRTVRGPVRDRVRALLTDRPVEGLKARAEGLPDGYRLSSEVGRRRRSARSCR